MGARGVRRPVPPGLSDLVKTHREHRGMSRKDLAAKTGVSLSMIRKVEQAQRRPSPRLIGELEPVLGATFRKDALQLLMKPAEPVLEGV